MTLPQRLAVDRGADSLSDIFRFGNRDRDNPDSDMLRWMQTSFPTEAEYSRVLDEKLLSRDGRAEKHTSDLRALGEQLHALVDDKLTSPFTITNLRWLSGGGSKMQVAFDLAVARDCSLEAGVHQLVIRLEPLESLNATSRVRESQIITAMSGTVPVPRVYWLDELGTWFNRPALIYSFVEGVTKPTGSKSHVGGVGGHYTGHLRQLLAGHFVDHIARIHTFDVSDSDHPLDSFTIPDVGSTDSALWQVNRARRVWEEDRGKDLAFIEVAANWLLRHLPELDRVSVLHGDYRTGNFLFNEGRGEITAWLDWERSCLGDRHRDLAWITLPQWGRVDTTGELLVSGLIPEAEFYARYTELSGLHVDLERLRYYRVLNNFQLVISSLGTAYRVARLGRSHQDILLTWIEGLAHAFARDLITSLTEAGA